MFPSSTSSYRLRHHHPRKRSSRWRGGILKCVFTSLIPRLLVIKSSIFSCRAMTPWWDSLFLSLTLFCRPIHFVHLLTCILLKGHQYNVDVLRYTYSEAGPARAYQAFPLGIRPAPHLRQGGYAQPLTVRCQNQILSHFWTLTIFIIGQLGHRPVALASCKRCLALP